MQIPELVLEVECEQITHLHRSTRDRLAGLGLFPKSVKIGHPDARKNGRVA